MSEGEALAVWRANTVSDYWQNYIQSGGNTEPDVLPQVAKEAKGAFRAVSREATDIGKEAHTFNQGFLNSVLAGAQVVGEPPPELPEHTEVRNCAQAALDWLALHKVEPVAVEKLLYSKKYNFAGTADLIANVDGQLALCDWKSSKSFYNKFLLQAAAYQLAWEEETGQRIHSRWLIRLGKYDGAFEDLEVPRKFYPSDRKAFLSCLSLHRWNLETNPNLRRDRLPKPDSEISSGCPNA